MLAQDVLHLHPYTYMGIMFVKSIWICELEFVDGQSIVTVSFTNFSSTWKNHRINLRVVNLMIHQFLRTIGT